MWGLFTIEQNGSVYLYLLGFYQMSEKLRIYLVYLLIRYCNTYIYFSVMIIQAELFLNKQLKLV